MLILLLIGGYILAMIAYKLPGLFILSAIMLYLFAGDIITTLVITEIGGAVYIVDIYIIALNIFFVLWILSKSHRKGKHSTIMSLVIIYYTVFIIGVIRGYLLYGHTALGLGRNFGFYTLYFFVTIHFMAKYNNPNNVLNWIIRLGFLAIIASVFKYINLLEIGAEQPHRAFSFFCASIIGIAFISLMVNRIINIKMYNKYRIYYLLIGLLLLIGIVISAIRSVWLALFVTLIFSGIVLNKKRFIKYTFRFIPYLLLIGLIIPSLLFKQEFAITQENVTSRFVGIIYPKEDHSSMVRLIAWSAYYDRFIKQPIFGEGVGNREEYYMPIETRYESNWIAMEPHNQYLMIAVQRGAIGLIPLLVLIFYVFTWLLKNKSKNALIDLSYLNSVSSGLIVVCLAVHQFFSNGDLLFWMALGVFYHSIFIYQSNKYSLPQK